MSLRSLTEHSASEDFQFAPYYKLCVLLAASLSIISIERKRVLEQSCRL